jgi:hypothetical protein
MVTVHPVIGGIIFGSDVFLIFDSCGLVSLDVREFTAFLASFVVEFVLFISQAMIIAIISAVFHLIIIEIAITAINATSII